MNILILSAGTRNKIVQYFKKELEGKGKVIATDCSTLAPAIYEADKYYIVPTIDNKEYIDIILDICKKENINTLISLIDPELSLIAKNINRFNDINVKPIISDYDKVELCFDKYEMYKFLTQNGFNTPKTYNDKDEFYNDLEKGKISFPVFMKPRKGSASININKVISKDEVEILYKMDKDLIIQEYMEGQEYGVDAYIDMISSEVIALFSKQKIKMRAGETDKSVSVKDGKLFDLIEKFITKVGFKGIIDIDVFKVNDEYYISEVNPRFGGGYPHAYECGVNVPQMIVNNICGQKNKKQIGKYDENIYMMKYNEIKIKER